jgi:Putative zinc-finger
MLRTAMERAPLRLVPDRPSGPIGDAEAARHAAAALPSVAEREAHALGLVALAGRPREEVARRLGYDELELSFALARARKEARRTVAALPGSGWCERAELLISDRLDGALATERAPRLDVHLRNCPRCVEHERRLVQATDGLIGGVAEPPVPEPPVVVELPPRPESPAAEPSEQPTLGGMVVFALAILLIVATVVLPLAGLI